MRAVKSIWHRAFPPQPSHSQAMQALARIRSAILTESPQSPERYPDGRLRDF